MANTLCPDSLDSGTKVISAIVLLRCILLRGGRCSADTKDVGPLLQCLFIILGRKCGVCRAVPEFCDYRKVIMSIYFGGVHGKSYLRMRGRVPLYPGHIPRTTSPQCCAVEMLCPPEQVLFQAAEAPDEDTKQPAGTPEYSDTAVINPG